MGAVGKSRGFSLIELMIALLLGTLVMAAAVGIFLTNRQTYKTTDNLGRIQENVRTAFELMSRDVREASGNACSKSAALVNVINSPSSRWWTRLDNWGNAVVGYAGTTAFGDSGFGTGTAQRLSGTDAFEIISTDSNVSTVQLHAPASATMQLNRADHGFAVGDLAVICNPSQATIFQVTSVSGNTIGHAAGGSPGNCTSNLGLPLNCAGGVAYQYKAPISMVARLNASRWFIANNQNARPALYQARLTSAGPVSQEVAEGVSGMTVSYLLDGASSYVGAGSVTDWSKVTSLRIAMTFTGEARSGSGNTALTRTLTQVVSIRNRNP